MQKNHNLTHVDQSSRAWPAPTRPADSWALIWSPASSPATGSSCPFPVRFSPVWTCGTALRCHTSRGAQRHLGRLFWLLCVIPQSGV